MTICIPEWAVLMMVQTLTGVMLFFVCVYLGYLFPVLNKSFYPSLHIMIRQIYDYYRRVRRS